MKQTITGKTGEWELVIGLEVHAQVISDSKLFSRSSTEFGSEPNSNVSFIDAGFPGMLPVINKKCVEQAIKSGLAINATINQHSVFDRKNYFYPDLPNGYQISQFKEPIVSDGYIDIVNENSIAKRIRVERIHLEQDAGKSLHDQLKDKSLLDLNRAGVALMEIVTKPDISSAFEAGEYIKKLRNILKSIETCSGDMEKGALRCDANVSVRRVGEKELGTRNEIKNLNSIKHIISAIESEAHRQIELLEQGGKVIQATRLYNPDTGLTKVMRSKEDAHDYRYFPDPDLLPLVITKEQIEEIKALLPELPDAKKYRYINSLNLLDLEADAIVNDRALVSFFEEILEYGVEAKMASSWLMAELLGRLNKLEKTIEDNLISPKKLSELILLIKDGTISGKIAKDILDLLLLPENSNKSASQLVEEKGLKQVTDNSLIEKIVQKVLDENKDKVQEYKNGKLQLFGFFVGQVMKEMKGKGNPSAINEILKKRL
ncbi:MAG: Asp-tRNA(Asn)/Glu-tRNA(Gln) amidotransferase subunit GatB [Alphaproteobacteria bacterium]|jgi:aspartyl-tRNA(Asn)/glutamyl-tRNA(Gln) amidotransferase subunit B